jgi:hypothetical protein
MEGGESFFPDYTFSLPFLAAFFLYPSFSSPSAPEYYTHSQRERKAKKYINRY